MNEEILSGLKVAVDRGSSLDSAVQSFINAGYNPSDVREAAAIIYQGGRAMPSLPSIQAAFPSKLPSPSMPSPEQKKPAASRTMEITLLVLALIVLLGLVVSVVVFRESIITFIENLFS